MDKPHWRMRICINGAQSKAAMFFHEEDAARAYGKRAAGINKPLNSPPVAV